MFCPNCGAEIGEDFNFCPFCEEILKKDSEDSRINSSISLVKREAQVSSQKEMKDKIYDFLMKNQGKIYTSKALVNRIDQITDNYNKLNISLDEIEKDLYKMVWEGKLNVEHRNGESYYTLNQEFSTSTPKELVSASIKDDVSMKNILYNFLENHKGRSFKVEEIIDGLEKEIGQLNSNLYSIQNVKDVLNSLAWDRKITSDTLMGNKYYMIPEESSNAIETKPLKYSSKPKKQVESAILFLVISSLVGVLLLIIGVSTVFKAPSSGITLIVISIILLGIGTKGRCFFVFLACDDCDCDC